MPDITVQFEFGSEGSLSKSVTGIINAEIGKIQSGILDQPLMLKLDIDPDSLSNVESRISSIMSKLETAYGKGNLAGSAPVSDAQRVAKATQATTTAIQEQIDALTGVSQKSKSAEQSATAMEKAWLDQRLQAERELQKLQSNSGNEAGVAAEKKKAAAAKETTTAIQEQIDALTGVSQKSKSAEQSATAMEKAWLNQSIQAEEADRSRARSIENIAKAQAQIGSLQTKFGASDFAAEKLRELDNLSSRLRDIKTDMEGMGDSLTLKDSKAYSAEVGNITTKITTLKTELESLSKASQDNFLTNPTAKGNAQTEINRKLSTAQTYLKNYTAAMKASDPEVRSAYSNIESLTQKYQELFDNVENGSISKGKFKEEIAGLNAALTENNRIIKDSGYAHKTLGDTLTTSMSKFAQYFTSTRIVMGAYRAMKEMVKESIAVDDAMTQLQIVTKANNAEMAAYSKTAFESAKRLGSSVTDVISATTTYARLGYTMKESGTLAELTTMLQGVGAIDAQSAQSAVTAIVKAFNDIDISNIDTVMDKLVAVGNGAPISVSELAEGLNNASSALSAAGNSFDQSVALLTAANTTIQDSAKSSTGLRTIAARIRNTKTELDALGETLTKAEYQDIVDALTSITKVDGTKASVSLTDTNGELRSTYDIIKDIADVWQYMDANQRAALAETLAGTRQQNIFYSLVENFNEAANAMELMEGSAGAMQSAYDIFLESTTAHIEQFKTAFAELSTDFLDTGIMNGLIDAGRIAIEVIDNIVATANKGGLLGKAGLVAGIGLIISAVKSLS